jgi:hypothetical protein
VRAAHAGDETLYEAYTALRADDGDIGTHGDASCVRVSRDELVQQLLSILGRHRVDRVERLLEGHTFACPLVNVESGNERHAWMCVVERLEGALAGAEAAPPLFEPCRRARCFAAHSVDWSSNEHIDTLLRTFSSQLLSAVKALETRDNDPILAAESLAVEDLIDYEARFLIDSIRGRLDPTSADDDSELSFCVDDL